jgi:tetratricopeptide (TPR) repeat protein
LALARGFQVRMGWAAKAGVALAEAKDAAAEGVCLDYDDPIAHGAFGIVHWMSGSHDLALRSIDRALALNPNRADLIHWKGLILDFTGDHEMAIHYHESALRLDPHHRASFATVNAFSGAYYELGDYLKAAKWARKSISMNPQYRRGHAVLAASLAQIGDEKGAAAALQTVFRLDPTFTLRTQLSGLIYKNTREVIAWEQGYKKAGLR